MKFVKLICLALCLVTVFSCKKDGSNGGSESIKFKPKFSNTQAIYLRNVLKASKGSITSTANLFQIDNDGVLTPLIDSVEVEEVMPFSKGLIVTLINSERYVVYQDNNYFKLPNSFDAVFKGENENGDLVFDDLSVIRNNSHVITKIPTSLSYPYIQSMSGDYAIVVADNITQILNTSINYRFNIHRCNGPRMVALSDTYALLDDCNEYALFNVVEGDRAMAGISSWNGESLYLKKGAAIMSQSLSKNSSFGLAYIGEYGQFTKLCNDSFNIGSTACMNCGTPNEVLFAYGDYFIIKEVDKVSVVKKGVLTKKVILSGYNVLNISVNLDKVFFVAEDDNGVRMAGIYSLTTENTTIVDTQENFDQVFTIK